MLHNAMGIDPCDGENHEIFNTTSKKSTGVDARTGLFEAYVPLPTITCNMGLGPAIDMSLSYTPMVNNRAGLGDGWSFAFTTYNEANKQLRLHSGEAVTVENNKDLPGPLVIAYWAADPETLTVKRPDGRVEVLKRAGRSQIFVPVSISQDGKSFATLEWEVKEQQLDNALHYQIRLASIADTAPAENATPDEARVHVRLKYAADDAGIQTIDVNFWEAFDTLACTYALTLKDYALTSVTLPEGHQYTFSYDDHSECGYLLSALTTPEGLTETVIYKDNGLSFLNDSKLSKLPCVATHITAPANEATKVTKQYTYEKAELYTLSTQQLSGLAEYLERNPDGVNEDFLVALLKHLKCRAEGALSPFTFTGYNHFFELLNIKSTTDRFSTRPKGYKLPDGTNVSEINCEHVYTDQIMFLIDALDIDFKLQPAYHTKIECGNQVEMILFGDDHQTLMTSTQNSSDNQHTASTFYVYKDSSISTQNFVNGKLKSETKSVFENARIIQRSSPQDTTEWTYLTKSHTVKNNGNDGYTFIPSQIATERTTYPDGTSTTAQFTYTTSSSKTR